MAPPSPPRRARPARSATRPRHAGASGPSRRRGVSRTPLERLPDGRLEERVRPSPPGSAPRHGRHGWSSATADAGGMIPCRELNPDATAGRGRGSRAPPWCPRQAVPAIRPWTLARARCPRLDSREADRSSARPSEHGCEPELHGDHAGVVDHGGCLPLSGVSQARSARDHCRPGLGADAVGQLDRPPQALDAARHDDRPGTGAGRSSGRSGRATGRTARSVATSRTRVRAIGSNRSGDGRIPEVRPRPGGERDRDRRHERPRLRPEPVHASSRSTAPSSWRPVRTSGHGQSGTEGEEGRVLRDGALDHRDLRLQAAPHEPRRSAGGTRRPPPCRAPAARCRTPERLLRDVAAASSNRPASSARLDRATGTSHRNTGRRTTRRPPNSGSAGLDGGDIAGQELEADHEGLAIQPVRRRLRGAALREPRAPVGDGQADGHVGMAAPRRYISARRSSSDSSGASIDSRQASGHGDQRRRRARDAAHRWTMSSVSARRRAAARVSSRSARSIIASTGSPGVSAA